MFGEDMRVMRVSGGGVYEIWVMWVIAGRWIDGWEVMRVLRVVW